MPGIRTLYYQLESHRVRKGHIAQVPTSQPPGALRLRFQWAQDQALPSEAENCAGNPDGKPEPRQRLPQELPSRSGKAGRREGSAGVDAGCYRSWCWAVALASSDCRRTPISPSAGFAALPGSQESFIDVKNERRSPKAWEQASLHCCLGRACRHIGAEVPTAPSPAYKVLTPRPNCDHLTCQHPSPLSC